MSTVHIVLKQQTNLKHFNFALFTPCTFPQKATFKKLKNHKQATFAKCKYQVTVFSTFAHSLHLK